MMDTKKLSIIVIVLAIIFVTQIGVQAQEEAFVVTAPHVDYLETYNIPELQHDPLWIKLTQHRVQTDALTCIQPYAYLTTYNIVGLEDDPMWQAGMIEFAVARVGQGA